MTAVETAEVTVGMQHPDGRALEPYELRDAVALAVHRLFDLRNPDTERISKLPKLDGHEEAQEVIVADPYRTWLLNTLTIEVDIDSDPDAITIRATARHS